VKFPTACALFLTGLVIRESENHRTRNLGDTLTAMSFIALVDTLVDEHPQTHIPTTES